VAAIVAAAAYFINRPTGSPTSSRRDPPDVTAHDARAPQSPPPLPDDLPTVIEARRSGAIVESGGTVTKTLPDDTEGDRHQRFIIRLAPGQTVLIAHNIDVAARVPIREGDTVKFKGEFEWNDRGGVVHWTHRDPRHRHADGWIELGGVRYE